MRNEKGSNLSFLVSYINYFQKLVEEGKMDESKVEEFCENSFGGRLNSNEKQQFSMFFKELVHNVSKSEIEQQKFVADGLEKLHKILEK